MDKINEILSYFTDENIFKKHSISTRAAYWKIGTSIFNTFDRLLENIKSLDISNPIESKFDQEMSIKNNKDNTYNFWLNGIKVTPCIKRDENKFVSKNAIGQYKDMLRSFGIGSLNNINYTDEVFCREGKIFLVCNAIELLQRSNRINLIKKVIHDGIYSHIKDTRNIAYSIIMEILFSFNYDFTKLLGTNKTFAFRKVQIKNKETTIDKKYLLDNLQDLVYVKNNIKKQGTFGTYLEIIECVKEKYDNAEMFFDEIYNEYFSNDDDYSYRMINENISKQNMDDRIKYHRSKFKDNIFENRKQKHLLQSRDEMYTDLVDSNNSQEFLKSKWNECEAAHIFDVHKIKKKLFENEINDELLESISDPNNGLMMKMEYHKYFDRGLWTFDINGNMLIDEENEDYLFNEIGLKRVKINPLVFNNEMKEYLKKRW